MAGSHLLARFALALAALVRTAPSCWGIETPITAVNCSSKVEWRVSEVRTVESGVENRCAVQGFGGLVLFKALAAACRILRAVSGWQSLHRWLRCIWTTAVPRRHVVVHVRGGGKTKIMLCEAERTVGAMREAIGVPLDAVMLLTPGWRELEDEMRVGEIVREGPITVEVRCRGVGGGEAEDEALGDAASKGNVNEVRRLLAALADVHSTTGLFANTPLQLSATYGHEEVSQMLIEAGANVNAATDLLYIPLHLSAYNGHMEMSQMLIEAGANVNAATDLGFTPLHLSAMNGHVEMSQMLVGAGANVNATDDEGNTPLDCAKQEGQSTIVALLQQAAEPLTKSAAQGGAGDADQ